MVTSGLLHWISNALNMTVHIREVCVFLAPMFSGLTAISTYFLTKELWNTGAALFAGGFMAIGKKCFVRDIKECFKINI